MMNRDLVESVYMVNGNRILALQDFVCSMQDLLKAVFFESKTVNVNLGSIFLPAVALFLIFSHL